MSKELTQELKDVIGGLTNQLSGIQKTHDERNEAQKKIGVDLSELQAKNEEQAKDFMTSLEKLEKAVARSNQATVTEVECDYQENYKSFTDLYKTQHPNKEIPTIEECKSSSEALTKYAQAGGDKSVLDDAEQKALNTIIGNEGGYLITPEYSQSMIDKRFDKNGIFGLIEKKSVGSAQFIDYIDYADYDSAKYLNELANTDPEDLVPNYKQLTWNNTEQITKVVISRNILEDSTFNLESDVLSKARKGASRQSAAQVVLGNGVDRPKGILAYAEGVDYNKIETIEGKNSLVVSWEDLISILPGALGDGYHDDAAYAMNRRDFFSLLSDKDTNGQFLLMNQINFMTGAGTALSVLGAPLVFDAALQRASTGAGTKSVIYGSFMDAYRFTDRIGFTIIVDNVTSGQKITFRLRRRNDGRLKIGDALKILKIKA